MVEMHLGAGGAAVWKVLLGLALLAHASLDAQILITPQHKTLPNGLDSARVLVVYNGTAENAKAVLSRCAQRIPEMGLQLDTVMLMRENPVLKAKDEDRIKTRYKQGRFTHQILLGDSYMAGAAINASAGERVDAISRCYLIMFKPTGSNMDPPKKGATQLVSTSYEGLLDELERQITKQKP